MTVFDPSNKEHRKDFMHFIKTRSWKDCKKQWIIGDDSNDVVHYISKVLLEYYVSREFVAKKPQKSKKIVKKAPENG